MGNRRRLTQVSGDYTSAQSDASLVAAATGAQIHVNSVYVMTDTAGTITFESDDSPDDVRWRVFPGANGGLGLSAPEGEALFSTDAGEALIVTSNIASNHFVSILYWIE